MNRFVFDNLIYKLNDNRVMLLNLTNYRRIIVTSDIVNEISIIENKINNNMELSISETKMFDKLVKSKQILSKELENQIYEILCNEAIVDLEKFPVRSITFNITHRCNFNCIYCYQNNYKFRSEYKNNMSIKEVDEIISYLSLPNFDSRELDEIVISGGESLLEENVDVVNYICNVIETKKRTIFTNGVNIIKFASRIDYSKIDEFQISLDGTNGVMKDVNHYCGGVLQILEGIDYLLKLDKKIDLVTMWTKQLEDNLDEFISLISESGFRNKPNFTMKIIVAKDYYNYNNLDLTIYDLEYIRYSMKKYNNKLRSIGCSIDLFAEASYLKTLLHRPINEIKTPRYKRCDINKSVPLLFEPNGEIHWCMCLGKTNGIIGNYKEKRVDVRSIQQYGSRTVFSMDKCRKCNLKYICSGGCVLGVPSMMQDLNIPVCSIFENEYFWEKLEDFV